MKIAKEIAAVKERNKRVEADKAWETSKVRRGLITIATYITAAVVFNLINVTNPYGNALIPTAAYAVSTMSLPFVKRWWLEYLYKK